MLRILSDSSCDISQQEAKTLGVEIFPLFINFDNDSYKDGIDIDNDKFYELLATAQNLPTTAQPSPLEFIERFEELKQSGDEMIVITLSSKISGTYQSALLYKRESGLDGVEVVDSCETIGMLREIVLEAVKMRDKMNVHELKEHLDRFKTRVRLWAIVDTLDYLHKGGRLNSASKIVGSLLNIKPLISVLDGEVKLIGKKAGTKAAIEFILERLKEHPIDYSYPIICEYSKTDTKLNMLIERLQREGYDLRDYYKGQLSPVVGAHVGPGALAFVYIEKED